MGRSRRRIRSRRRSQKAVSVAKLDRALARLQDEADSFMINLPSDKRQAVGGLIRNLGKSLGQVRKDIKKLDKGVNSLW